MWFYLPKNRSQVHRTRKVFYHDTPYKQNRRQRYAVFPKLREAFFFCLFMIIALRMGTLALLSMVDLHNLRANIFVAEHLEKPDIPEATYISRWNPGNMVLISIDNNGNILLEGKSYSIEYLPDAIDSSMASKPFGIAALVIDKDCEMRHVHKLYKAMRRVPYRRELGFWRIIHIAKPSASLKDEWRQKYQKLPFR